MLTAPALEVAVHRGDPAELADLWRSVSDAEHPGAAFRSAAWLAPWWKTHSPGRTPHILSPSAADSRWRCFLSMKKRAAIS